MQLGQILQTRRKELNIEIQVICAKFNIKPKIIEAIENDDWKEVENISYITGLISSYANFLKLDAEIINQKIKDINIKSNVKNTKHRLVNIGEHIDLTPHKEMFINFAIASFLLFFIFLAIYNSSTSKENKIKNSFVIKEISKIPQNTMNSNDNEEN
jgi:cytoskeletal protein RodZ